MPEGKAESSGFKVVDRRGFASDGTRRESVAEEEKPTAKPPPAPAEPPRDKAYPGLAEDDDLGPPDFDTIISYLSTTAMFQLGLLAGPGGQHLPPDLLNARRTIDMLEVLQDKTRGNLSANESRLLEDVLYELRMSFVAVQNQSPRKP
jgi:hypothetical protein